MDDNMLISRYNILEEQEIDKLYAKKIGGKEAEKNFGAENNPKIESISNNNKGPIPEITVKIAGKERKIDYTKQLDIASLSSAIHEDIIDKAYQELAVLSEKEIKDLTGTKLSLDEKTFGTAIGNQETFSAFLINIDIQTLNDRIDELEKEESKTRENNTKLIQLKAIKKACISRTILNTPYSSKERWKIDLKTIYDYFNDKREKLKDKLKTEEEKIEEERNENRIKELRIKIENINNFEKILAYLWARNVDEIEGIENLEKWEDIKERFSYKDRSILSIIGKIFSVGGSIASLYGFMTPIIKITTTQSKWWEIFKEATATLSVTTNPIGLIGLSVLGGGLLLDGLGKWFFKRNFLNHALNALKEPLYTFSLSGTKREGGIQHLHTDNTKYESNDFYLNCLKLDGGNNELVFDTKNIHGRKDNNTTNKQANNLYKVGEKNTVIKKYYDKLNTEGWWLWKKAKNIPEKERIGLQEETMKEILQEKCMKKDEDKFSFERNDFLSLDNNNIERISINFN